MEAMKIARIVLYVLFAVYVVLAAVNGNILTVGFFVTASIVFVNAVIHVLEVTRKG